MLIFELNKKKDNININNAIRLAVNYIQNHTLENGKFVYIVNIDTKKQTNKKYNILRHGGTIYSMYLLERYHKNYSLNKERYLTSEYLIDNYIKQIAPDMFAVVSKPEEEEQSGFHTAKTGGAGIALAGLSNLLPDKKIDVKILEGLSNFILYMQKSDGSFYSKYNIDKEKIDENYICLYYPGEAAYGLLFLNEFLPSKKLVNASKKALLYLANSRCDKGLDVSFDHWAMLATKKLFETGDNNLNEEEKSLLISHAEQMANSILKKQITDKNDKYRGGFIKNLKLCSIATIMEGLGAIYYCTGKNIKLKLEILNALHLGTNFLFRYQIKQGEMRGGVPISAEWKLKDADKKTKDIRIDNIQHALSAWISYLKIINTR